jgi:hypothetical protein
MKKEKGEKERERASEGERERKRKGKNKKNKQTKNEERGSPFHSIRDATRKEYASKGPGRAA